MIYSLIIVSCITLYIIIKSFKTTYGIWLSGVYLGFCISIIGLVLYSVYFWDYYYVRTILFDVPSNLIIWIYQLNLSSYAVNRILNIGEAIFYYCVIGFGLSYSHTRSYSLKYYLLLAIPPLLLVTMYDPYIVNELYSLFLKINRSADKNFDFFAIFKFIQLLHRFWFITYTVIAMYQMFAVYRGLKNTFIRHKTLGIHISIATLFILHLLIFYWTPEHLIIIRGNSAVGIQNYYYDAYYQINMIQWRTLYYLYPILATFSFISLLYALYKYNIFNFLLTKNIRKPSTSIQLEEVSSSISHMVKNRLLEIQYISESADYTREEQHLFIQKTCEDLIGRLDILQRKNRKIQLNFMHTPISTLTEHALQRINPSSFPHITFSLSNKTHNQYCFCDVNYMTDVIVNLVYNAIEAIQENHGNITITCSTERMWNIICIDDNGPGILKEHKEKIFSPFYTTKNSGKNWGVGLSYCQKITKAHNGEILLENKKTETGVTASILLPVAPSFSRGQTVLKEV